MRHQKLPTSAAAAEAAVGTAVERAALEPVVTAWASASSGADVLLANVSATFHSTASLLLLLLLLPLLHWNECARARRKNLPVTQQASLQLLWQHRPPVSQQQSPRHQSRTFESSERGRTRKYGCDGFQTAPRKERPSAYASCALRRKTAPTTNTPLHFQ